MRSRTPGTLAVAGVAALAILWAACSHTAPEPAARLIRVGYTGEADFGDLPSFIAHGRLRDHGVNVETTHFSAADLAVQAVSSGSVDLIHGSMISAWMAVSRGAHLRTIMEHVANPYRLVVTAGIASCAELTGRRLALPSESSVSTHLVRAFIGEECPTAKPDVFLLTESSSRAAAFLAGGVDAGALELSSLLWLTSHAPDRFHVLSNFSTRWPSIKTTGVHVNTAFADRRPDVVREYLAALLAANRDVGVDPGLLVSAASDTLGRSEDWAAAADAYLNERVWPANGGLTKADVTSTLDFFKTYSRLDKQLTAEAVVDLRFLEGVLAEARRSTNDSRHGRQVAGH